MCASEVSDIEASLIPAYPELVVWAIASGEPEDLLESWRAAFDIDIPILVDSDRQVTDLYAGSFAFPTGAYPQEWLIGTDGIIEYYGNEYEYDALAEIIEAELE